LEHFETPLWQVLDSFRPTDDLFTPAMTPSPSGTYDRAAVFAEFLGVSPAEYRIFTKCDPVKWYELYGYSSGPDALTELKSAKALARRLGVSIKELVGIVKTNFANPELDELSIVWKLGLEPSDI